MLWATAGSLELIGRAEGLAAGLGAPVVSRAWILANAGIDLEQEVEVVLRVLGIEPDSAPGSSST